MIKTIKKLFSGDRVFYGRVLTLALPIALQSLITIGVNMLDTLCGTVNSIVSGDKTVAQWQAAVEEVSDKLRAAME